MFRGSLFARPLRFTSSLSPYGRHHCTALVQKVKPYKKRRLCTILLEIYISTLGKINYRFIIQPFLLIKNFLHTNKDAIKKNVDKFTLSTFSIAFIFRNELFFIRYLNILF